MEELHRRMPLSGPARGQRGGRRRPASSEALPATLPPCRITEHGRRPAPVEPPRRQRRLARRPPGRGRPTTRTRRKTARATHHADAAATPIEPSSPTPGSAPPGGSSRSKPPEGRARPARRVHRCRRPPRPALSSSSRARDRRSRPQQAVVASSPSAPAAAAFSSASRARARRSSRADRRTRVGPAAASVVLGGAEVGERENASGRERKCIWGRR
nr:uncharacterized protein LOC127310129 [Lolium perenne]